jgi:hypothetical protein
MDDIPKNKQLMTKQSYRLKYNDISLPGQSRSEAGKLINKMKKCFS